MGFPGTILAVDAGDILSAMYPARIMQARARSKYQPWVRTVVMHVYSAPLSEYHVNRMARVEAPQRFPAAISGAEKAEEAGMLVEYRS